MTAIMIGLVGTNGSGKSTICDYLVGRGFQRYSLSSVIHNYVREKGLPTTRDNLVDVSNRLTAQKERVILLTLIPLENMINVRIVGRVRANMCLLRCKLVKILLQMMVVMMTFVKKLINYFQFIFRSIKICHV